jgi:hypothetical protein
MVRVASLFSQILQNIPRTEFAELVVLRQNLWVPIGQQL